jgi:hypothetical protein
MIAIACGTWRASNISFPGISLGFWIAQQLVQPGALHKRTRANILEIPTARREYSHIHP